MLKSFANGIGGGLGRLVGKVIGVAILGFLAYGYFQKNNFELNKKINNITEGIFYEKD